MRGVNDITIRSPRREDGAAIHDLVVRAGTLEPNSAYCYLLLADHFASTCVVATHDEQLVGAVLGYRPPSEPEGLFVWQVAVDASMRGKGLGLSLLHAFTRTPGARGAQKLLATVAPSNTASNKLFASFARTVGASLRIAEGYPAELFPDDHEDERLITIHPLPALGAISSEASP